MFTSVSGNFRVKGLILIYLLNQFSQKKHLVIGGGAEKVC